MVRHRDRTIINPYYHELRRREPVGIRMSAIELARSNRAFKQTEEILVLMDDYGIKHYKDYKNDITDFLAHNKNVLTIEMLNQITLTKIDGQVGQIIVDHINHGIYNMHSYNRSEWRVME